MGQRTKALLGSLFATLSSVALCVYFYRLWGADLRVPMVGISGDGTSFLAMTFKGMIDNPWYLDNHFVGAPNGMDLRDFPQPDLLLNLWAKGASLFTKNPFLVANLTFILSFPLVTLPSLFTLRRLGVRYSVALAASLLFAFLSFHQMRGLHHVYFSVGYFSVPLAMGLALDLVSGKTLLVEEGRTRFRPKLALKAPGSVLAVVVALVIGLTGTVYFTVFSAILVGLAGAIGAFRQRAKMPLVRAAIVLGIAGACFVVHVSPTLLHFREHGRVAVLERNPHDAEFFGMKITQLVLPLSGHRYEPFRRFKQQYDLRAPLVNENKTAYLGLVGAFGFLYLVASMFTGRRKVPETDEDAAPAADGVANPEVMRGLRVLSLGALLLGTVGGFGAILAFTAFPEVRSYNRISVYIAFVSLAAVAFLVERGVRRRAGSKLVMWLLPVALATVTVIGLFDQMLPNEPPYDLISAEFHDEEAFVHSIEGSLPPNASVFELPYMSFPENGPVQKLEDYALFRPYLLSKTLHWSYGVVKGRRGDAWYKAVASEPAAEMVDTLALAGFSGIYVAREGYADGGAAIESSLGTILGPPTLINPKATEAFFPLAARAEALRGELGDETFAARADEAAHPLYLGWRDGFYGSEAAKDEHWVWARKSARFVIDNPSKETRSVVFEANLRAGKAPATVRFSGDLFTAEVRLEGPRVHFVKPLVLPPGEHFMKMETDGERGDFPGDVRDLFTEVHEAKLREP